MISLEQLDHTQLDMLQNAENSLKAFGWKAEGHFASKFRDGWSTPFQVEMVRSIGAINSIFRISISEKNTDNFALMTIYDKTDNYMIRFDTEGDYNSAIDEANLLLESASSASIHDALLALALKNSQVSINVNDKYVALTPSNLIKAYK